MTQRPTPPVVRTGYWRHEDGTKEHGIRIQCGIRHVYIEPHNIRKLADQLHDYADRHEEDQ
ncbi:hypothetical protein [Brachybacterium sp. J153]|uniref:hypothetical protein n=1 Tax=Brachybacterium sp. J153 TaxID=3116488 RepID=UPI002E78CECB|nr:hypothetical protein [Brachybacterium sp. J153]MEE1617313.1 hypothetical protein [Brachybacterium sp. J153]